MTLSIRLAALGLALSLALPVTASAQADDSGYCQALSTKYQRYVLDKGGTGKMATPNISVEAALGKCGSDPAGSIRVLEKALTDARLDLPPRS